MFLRCGSEEACSDSEPCWLGRGYLQSAPNLMIVEKNAEMTIIICDHTLSRRNSWQRSYRDIWARMQFNIVRVQNEHNNAAKITHTFIHQEQNSTASSNNLHCMAGSSGTAHIISSGRRSRTSHTDYFLLTNGSMSTILWMSIMHSLIAQAPAFQGCAWRYGNRCIHRRYMFIRMHRYNGLPAEQQQSSYRWCKNGIQNHSSRFTPMMLSAAMGNCGSADDNALFIFNQGDKQAWSKTDADVRIRTWGDSEYQCRSSPGTTG